MAWTRHVADAGRRAVFGDDLLPASGRPFQALRCAIPHLEDPVFLVEDDGTAKEEGAGPLLPGQVGGYDGPVDGPDWQVELMFTLSVMWPFLRSGKTIGARSLSVLDQPAKTADGLLYSSDVGAGRSGLQVTPKVV